MKKVVLFDIDYTLFDKDIFLDSLFSSIGDLLGIEKGQMKKIGDVSYKENIEELDHFDPKYFSSRIAKNLNREENLESIEDLVSRKYNSPGSLYEESIKTLGEISKIATVGILSKGHSVFQRNKIFAFIHLLDEAHIYITDDKYKMLESIMGKYKDIELYIVDDLLDILYASKKLKDNVFTIWIKRGVYADSQEEIPGFIPDATVLNLSEIIPIILGSDNS